MGTLRPRLGFLTRSTAGISISATMPKIRKLSMYASIMACRCDASLQQAVGLLHGRRTAAHCECATWCHAASPAAGDSRDSGARTDGPAWNCVRRSSMVVTKEMPTLAPTLRARLMRPGGGIVFVRRQIGIGHGVDGHEQERQPSALNHPRQRQRCGSRCSRSKRGHVKQRRRQHAQAENHQVSRIAVRASRNPTSGMQRNDQRGRRASAPDRPARAG